MFSEEDKYSQNGNPLGNLMSTSIGLSPFAFAGLKMWGTVKSNAAVNPGIPFGVGTASHPAGGNISAVSRAIGQSVQSNMRDSTASSLNRVKELTDNIMASDNVQKMFSSISEQNALIQSLLETIDDPSSGLHDVLLGYKERLLSLARDSNNVDTLQNTIKEVVKAINTQGTENSRIRWERNLREHRKLGASLTPPTVLQNAGQPFNEIMPSNLQGNALKRYETLLNKLGPGASSRISLVTRDWGGAQQVYARVYSKGAGKGRFLDSVPLQVSRGSSDALAIFTGESLQTGYVAPRQVFQAGLLQNVFNAGGPVNFSRLRKEAGMGIDKLFFDEFLNRLSKGKDEGGMSADSARNYRAWKAQFMNVMPRVAYSSGGLSTTSHLQKVYGQVGNTALVTGLDKLNQGQQEQLMTRLGTSEGMDAYAPGYQFLVNGLGNQPIGRVGIAANSPLNSLLTTSGANRGMFPVESRIEQVWGRENQFVRYGKARTMGRGRTMTAGPTSVASGYSASTMGKNIEWADNLTGATNKFVILDAGVGGKGVSALAGQGAALYSGKDIIRSFQSKPILDPMKHGYMGSKMLEHIMGKIQPGGWMEVTDEMLKEHGSFLGFGPGGNAQFLRESSRTQKYHVGYEVLDVWGKQQINLMIQTEKRMGDWKGFSTAFKGVMHNIRWNRAAKLASEMGYDESWMRKMGLTSQDVVLAPADMMKKGAGFLDLQMTSAYGFLSGDKDYLPGLQALAQTQQYSSLPKHQFGRTTGAIIKSLSNKVQAGVITPDEAGKVLAMTYTLGGTDGVMKGVHSAQAINRMQIDKAITDAFGSNADIVRSVAAKGYSFMPTSMTQGMGVEDYGLGRGSFEPRTIKLLQHRLQSIGLSVDQAGEVIASMYQGKMGHASNIRSAQGMVKMLESMTGNAGVMEGFNQFMNDVPRYDLSNVSKIAAEGFQDFIAKNPEGFVFDFTSGANNEVTRAIASHAQDIFGQGQVFIPGKDVADSMRDVAIKQAGKTDTQVAGEYTRMMSNLFEGMSSATSQKVSGIESGKLALSNFKNQSIDLASRVIHNVARGKVKGLQSMIAKVYDIDAGTTFSSPRHLRTARHLLQKTKGQAIFMDKSGFLSQLNDWMGGNTNKSTIHDAAKKAEKFFLGSYQALEGRTDKAKGVMQFSMRHPLLSVGNIAPAQIFRHLGEVGTTDRDVFEILGGLEGGRWKGVKNWDQVIGMSSRERHGFFYDMVENVGSLAPEGGGSVYYPRTVGTVKVAGRAEPFKVDMAIAGAALGDFDGDQWMSMMLHHKAGNHIMSNLNKDKDWVRAENIYKIKSEIFTEEAKAGLKALEKMKGVEWGSNEMVREGMLKEQAAKASVGKLDVRLTKLRTALLDLKMTGKASRESVSDALAMLKVLEEHASIKGKKLPVFMPFAENVSKAVDYFFDTGSSASFENILRTQIFPGSDLWNKEGMMIESVDSPYLYARTISNEKMSLNTTLQTIQRAVDVSRVTGSHLNPNAYYLGQVLKSGNEEEKAKVIAMMNAGESLETGIIHQAKTGKSLAAGAEVMGHQFFSVLRNMDKSMLGLGAAGVVGSLAVLGLTSHQGYSSEPLVMPGEMVSPDIRQRMGQGDLLSVSKEKLSTTSDAYGTFGRPQGTPMTYLAAPSAYQIRGEIPSMKSLPALNNYLGTLGNSSGSLRVNDTRNPITENYVDRLVGMY